MTDCYIGIDTCNYTTSAAVCDGDGRVVANLKIPLPVKAGERGLRQSDAVFHHVKNLPEIMQSLREELARGEYSPVAIGVSVTPRDVQGSYMPCFLSGRAAAYSAAAVSGVPVYEFSHQSGHVMAALYSSGHAQELTKGEFLAFHVSGGTTEALLVNPKGAEFDIELVGQTNDINAGQAIDRVGVAMGLAFPCGRELESYAASYVGEVHRHKVCVRDGNCSLSGAENIALKIYEQTGDVSASAAFLFEFIGDTLSEMAQQLLQKYGKMPVLFAGGVMSNKLMRTKLLSRFEAYFAEPAYSADNAAGTALLCRAKHMMNIQNH